ncbi:B4GA1 glucuronyltransferase, partial [Acromyrmex heyeri]
MRSLARKLLIWPATLVLSLLAFRLLFGRDFRLPTTTLVFRDDGDISTLDNSHINSQQDAGPPGPPVYAAGMYMAGQRPRNESACRWYHGLPDVLSYPPSRLTWSSEIGEKSPYRVLPFVLLGAVEATDSLPQITLSTHATADQVYGIVELARRWEGPLSLAVFAPGLDAGLAVVQLDRACRCEPAMYKVSVHLVFPAGRPPALSAISRIQGDCAASDLQWRQAETERRKRRMTYPINVTRNVARTMANTSRVLVSDIELLPSARLASGFMEMVHHRPPKHDASRRFVCPHCQRFPGLTRWLIRPDPGRIRPLIVTRREYPHHRWEPLFIGTRNDPLYTEEMSWEGKQDKMTQMFEMCLLNYRLVVLDGAFLVHTPGIKRKARKINTAIQEFFRSHERRNARIYQHVIKRLIKRYPINRRCAH